MIRLADLIYAGSLFMLGLAQLSLWRHASVGHRLIDRSMAPEMVRYMTARSVVPLIGTLIVPGLVLVVPVPPMANMGYLSIFIGMSILRKRFAPVLEQDAAARRPLEPARNAEVPKR